MRRPSATVIARQSDKATERTEATAARFAQLSTLAPDANPADLKYLAIHCGTTPTYPTILRVLSALSR